MTRDEAAILLGIASDAPQPEIRSAFRRLLFRHHPDVSGTSGAVATHELVAAYRLLQSPAVEAPPVEPAAPWLPGPVHHGDTVHVALPPGQAYAAVMETAHDIGDVAHLDRLSGLIETIVRFDGYSVCSVLCAVEPGRRGWTDVTVMVESLTGGAAPSDEDVAALLADRLAGVLRRR